MGALPLNGVRKRSPNTPKRHGAALRLVTRLRPCESVPWEPCPCMVYGSAPPNNPKRHGAALRPVTKLRPCESVPWEPCPSTEYGSAPLNSLWGPTGQAPLEAQTVRGGAALLCSEGVFTMPQSGFRGKTRGEPPGGPVFFQPTGPPPK
jgi:hypothetical protein